MRCFDKLLKICPELTSWEDLIFYSEFSKNSHLRSSLALINVQMAVFSFKSSRAFAEEASFRVMTFTITFAWRNRRCALVDILAALSPIAPFVTSVAHTFRSFDGVGTVGV